MQKNPTHSHLEMENLDHRVSNCEKKARKINVVKLNRKIGGLAWSSNELLDRKTWKKKFGVIKWCNTMYHFENPSKNKRLVGHRFDFDYVKNLTRFLICNFWFLFLTCRPNLQYGYILLPRKWVCSWSNQNTNKKPKPTTDHYSFCKQEGHVLIVLQP